MYTRLLLIVDRFVAAGAPKIRTGKPGRIVNTGAAEKKKRKLNTVGTAARPGRETRVGTSGGIK